MAVHQIQAGQFLAEVSQRKIGAQIVGLGFHFLDERQGKGFLVHLDSPLHPLDRADDLIVDDRLLGGDGPGEFQVPRPPDDIGPAQELDQSHHRPFESALGVHAGRVAAGPGRAGEVQVAGKSGPGRGDKTVLRRARRAWRAHVLTGKPEIKCAVPAPEPG
jgi:hypothetical protein